MRSLIVLVITLTVAVLAQDGGNTSDVTTTAAPGKFGLAWLFSGYNKKKPKLMEDEKEKVDVRIKETVISMTAAKGNIRVETSQWSKKKVKGSTHNVTELLCEEYKKEEEEHTQKQESSGISRQGPVLKKLDAREFDRLVMTCTLHNVHHEVDLDSFFVDWLRAEQQESSEEGDEEDKEKEKSAEVVPQCTDVILESRRPDCRIYTDFPFVDLQESTKNISCSSELILESLSVNDTGSYHCRGRVGFSDVVEEEHYRLATGFHLRVSKRDDYSVHKIISMIIGALIVLTLVLVIVKKVLNRKLAWEFHRESYLDGTVPARRIASAGSFSYSRSTLRRPSEPGIAEEDEDDDTSEYDLKKAEDGILFKVVETEEPQFHKKSSLKNSVLPNTFDKQDEGNS